MSKTLRKSIGWILMALVAGTISMLFLLSNGIGLQLAIIIVSGSLLLAGIAILSFNLINTK